MYPLFFI